MLVQGRWRGVQALSMGASLGSVRMRMLKAIHWRLSSVMVWRSSF